MTKIGLLVGAIVFFFEGIFMFTVDRWSATFRAYGNLYTTIAGIIAILIGIGFALSIDLVEIPIPVKIPLTTFYVIILAIIGEVCSCGYGVLVLLVVIAVDAKE